MKSLRIAIAVFALGLSPAYSVAEMTGFNVRPATQTGTLNLVLANRKGFVIAADSRRSSDTPFECGGTMRNFCDDSQKLFKTGDKSAMVIAGFANGGVVGVKGTPLSVEVASFLRRKFGENGIPGELGSQFFVAGWVGPAFSQALTGVAGVYDPATTSPDKLDFIATVAGFGKDGAPTIAQLYFQAVPTQVGSHGTTIFYFSVRERNWKVEHFTPITSGIDEIATRILNGEYQSDETAIASYYSKLRRRQLDDLSLVEMESLAHALLDETSRSTRYVGGGNQVGIFPVGGEARLQMPALPTSKTVVPTTMLRSGCLYSPDAPNGVPLPGSRVSMFMDAQNWGEAPTSQYFLASEFRGAKVILDNNFFVNSRFERVIFKYFGAKNRDRRYRKQPFLLLRNRFDGCTVEVPRNVKLPRNSGLHGCRVVKKLLVEDDPQSIGRPLHEKTYGHVTKNPNGTVTFSTDTTRGSFAGYEGPVMGCSAFIQ